MPVSMKKDKSDDTKGHSFSDQSVSKVSSVSGNKSVSKSKRSMEDDVKGHSFSDKSVSSVSSVSKVSGTKKVS